MSDKLRIIKKKLKKEAWIYWVDDPASRELSKNAELDVLWLISELEKCRAENKELNRIFNFQLERMDEADKLWQEATGKHDTSPDLGVLLEWLMAEIKELEERINKWRQGVEDADILGMGWKDKAEKAEAEVKRLKKQEGWWIEQEALVCPEGASFVEYIGGLTCRAEKAEAEVKRLNAILANQGLGGG